jgi:hypothetical protein
VLAARAREREGEAHDALDLEVAVDQRVARGQHAVFDLEAFGRSTGRRSARAR